MNNNYTPPYKLDEIISMRKEGKSWGEISSFYNRTRIALLNWLKRTGINQSLIYKGKK